MSRRSSCLLDRRDVPPSQGAINGDSPPQGAINRPLLFVLFISCVSTDADSRRIDNWQPITIILIHSLLFGARIADSSIVRVEVAREDFGRGFPTISAQNHRRLVSRQYLNRSIVKFLVRSRPFTFSHHTQGQIRRRAKVILVGKFLLEF